jgi:hypothetical protein
MAAASRSLATALWGARFASGLLHPSYTTNRDTIPPSRRMSSVGETVRRFGIGPATNLDGPRNIQGVRSLACKRHGESWSLSAMRAKSGKEDAFIFRMT